MYIQLQKKWRAAAFFSDIIISTCQSIPASAEFQHKHPSFWSTRWWIGTWTKSYLRTKCIKNAAVFITIMLQWDRLEVSQSVLLCFGDCRCRRPCFTQMGRHKWHGGFNWPLSFATSSSWSVSCTDKLNSAGVKTNELRIHWEVALKLNAKPYTIF